MDEFIEKSPAEEWREVSWGLLSISSDRYISNENGVKPSVRLGISQWLDMGGWEDDDAALDVVVVVFGGMEVDGALPIPLGRGKSLVGAEEEDTIGRLIIQFV